MRVAGVLLLMSIVAIGPSGCGKGGDRQGQPAAPHIPAKVASASAEPSIDVAAIETPDAEIGQQVFVVTCASCHGFQAQGLPHQGAPLRSSAFVASHDDQSLIEFIKRGRPAKDPANTSGVPMPPRGNNPALSDARVADVVAFLRQVQAEAKNDGQPTAAVSVPAPATP
jgi:disulfide bond formation protein DsbB